MPKKPSLYLLLLLFMLCTSLILAGCASRSSQDSKLKEHFPVNADEYVFVKVTGQDQHFREDLASLIVTSLQSEYGIIPASNRSEADLYIEVHVKDIAISEEQSRISGQEALGNTAMGSMLGLAIGSLAGDRTGAIIGLSAGAALGLGLSAAESSSYKTWVIVASITMQRKSMQAVTQDYASATGGKSLSRNDAVEKLKVGLAQDIVVACKK